MKVTLISPASDVFTRGALAFKVARLSLGAVSNATPEDLEVEIIDENKQLIDFDKRPDIVGITALTALAPRAYAIADSFRARGIPVVLGGIHPTVLPNEALLHADCVVVGEAEEVWPVLLRDFQNGRLKKFYGSQVKPQQWNNDVHGRSHVVRKRLSKTNSFFTVLQATRGCPFNCNFCTVPIMYGSKIRALPVEQVVKQIKSSLGLLKGRTVLFFDDNFTVKRSYAESLCKALIPLKIRWASQGNVLMARDGQLLDLMYRSGCRLMFIGFESLCENNLLAVGKKSTPVSEYAAAIKIIQSHGIGVCGSFVYGFDHDDVSVFERTVAFAQKAKLEMASFSILTPYPGTPLFCQLSAEQRIMHTNWNEYTAGHTVFHPKHMTASELTNGYIWSRQEFFSISSIIRRFQLSTPYAAMLPVNLWTRKASNKLIACEIEEGGKNERSVVCSQY